MATLSFRQAVREDAPALASLINKAFRSEKTGQTWLYDSQEKRVDIVSSELILGFIDGPTSIMLVGSASTTTTSSDAAVTCYLAKPADAPHRTPGAAWMGFLAVSPDMHRHGYGLAMLHELERFLVEEWGVNRLEFDFVSTRLQLRAWYEKHGYRATGKSRPFHYGEKGHEILAPGLEMIVLGKDL